MNLFKLVGSIFIDTEKANDSMSKTDSKAEKLAKKFVEGATTAAKWGAGITTAAVGMAVAAGAAIQKVTDDTREYRNEMGKLETAFETSNFSATTAKETYRELQSILGETDQSVEAANHLAKLCTNEKELADWTNICTGVYATFGASLPIEGLTEAANETSKTGQLTGALADALNWAGVNEESFQKSLDECSNEQERQALITDTLNRLYSETASVYRENNAEVIEANKAQEKLNETMAKVGAKLEPYVTKAKLLGATLVDNAIPAVEEFIEENGIVELTLGAVEKAVGFLHASYMSLSTLIKNVSNGWKESVKWIREHETGLQITAIAMATVTTAVLAYNSAKIAKKALDMAETAQIYLLIAAENAHTVTTTIATTATTAFGTAVAFLTSPITIAIAAIGALIAIGVALYKNWDMVKEKARELGDWISEKWTELKDNTIEKWENMKQNVDEKITSMKNNASQKADEIRSKFNETWSNLQSKTTETWSKIKTTVDQNGGGITGIIRTATQGYKNLWRLAFNEIDSLTGGKLGSALSTVQTKMESIRSAISSKINSARDAVRNAVDTIKNVFTGWSWSLPKIKTPHFSVSGGEAPWGFGGKGSLPKVNVAWYNRALEKPMVLDNAEIFGYNAATGNFLGGGETKTEYITGEEALVKIVRDAIRMEQDGYLEHAVSILENIFAWLVEGGLKDLVVEILTSEVKIRWRDREVARMVRANA